MDDTVSRAAAIDAVSRGCQEFRGIFAECEKNLNALPTVQPCEDVVSRQVAIEAWKEDFKGFVNSLDMPRDDYKGIMEYIDEVPSVQPEIIRCKDCKHWGKRGLCEIWDYYISNEDFYCGCAKRRTE